MLLSLWYLTSKYLRKKSNLRKLTNKISWAVVWLSCLSSRFRHQRSAVQMHSSAKFILNNVYCQLYWKVDNNEKEAGNGPLFLKKTRDQGFTTKLGQNVSIASPKRSWVSWLKIYYNIGFNIASLGVFFWRLNLRLIKSICKKKR